MGGLAEIKSWGVKDFKKGGIRGGCYWKSLRGWYLNVQRGCYWKLLRGVLFDVRGGWTVENHWGGCYLNVRGGCYWQSLMGGAIRYLMVVLLKIQGSAIGNTLQGRFYWNSPRGEGGVLLETQSPGKKTGGEGSNTLKNLGVHPWEKMGVKNVNRSCPPPPHTSHICITNTAVVWRAFLTQFSLQ